MTQICNPQLKLTSAPSFLTRQRAALGLISLQQGQHKENTEHALGVLNPLKSPSNNDIVKSVMLFPNNVLNPII